MANALQSDLSMHRFYDLKGSSQGRTIDKAEEQVGAIFKDLDLDFEVFLKPSTRCQLLVYIFVGASGVLFTRKRRSSSRLLPKLQDIRMEFRKLLLKFWKADAKFGVRMPARVVRLIRNEKDGIAPNQVAGLQESHSALLQIGIIGIEHAYKSVQYHSRSISAVNPKAYSTRFQDFFSGIFQAEEPVL